MKKITNLLFATALIAGASGASYAESPSATGAPQSGVSTPQSGVSTPQSGVSTSQSNQGMGAANDASMSGATTTGTSADANASISGKVTKVDAKRDTVMIKQDSGAATSLSVPDSARVLKADGTLCKLEDVKSGQRVTATQDGQGQVTELRINKAS